jgi:hypothetical protein
MKSKEEMLKELEKNYYSVQKKEYQVYEQDDKLKQNFDKLAKSGLAKQKQEQKKCATCDKETITKFKKLSQELKKTFDVKKSDLEVTRKEAKTELANQLKVNKEVVQSQKTEVKIEIELANKENEDSVASTLTQYESDVEHLKKRVVVLNEKLKKDNRSFEQKLSDIQAKHEQVVEFGQENEQTKTKKLAEASKKDTIKITEEIETNREKVNRRLEALKTVYDDELEEIDENIEAAQADFDDKYANIKTSNEQRIAVREKHLQRALDDKDNRSAKAHRKDVAKIQKEMERDLQLLKKQFDTAHEVSVDYRFNFIQDNFEKWAGIERDYITSQENKQLEINVLNAGLESRITLAKLDFEKQHVTALEAYHKQYAETKEKQFSFELETHVNLENEALERQILALRFKEDNDVNIQILKERLESLRKQQKDIELQKEESDFKAKSILDKAITTVEHDSAVAKLELDYLQKQAMEDEKIEHHTTEFTRHDAFKNELLGFETNIKDLFIVRQNEMVEYETLEVNNRFEVKEKYLHQQIAELGKDYTVMVAKAEEINKLDKVFYETKIEEATGSMQDELNEFIETETTKLEEKEAKLRSLNPKRKKKEYRAFEEEVNKFRTSFEDEKAQKQNAIDEKVEVYKNAFNHSNERLATALTEMESFFTKELNMLENALSDCEGSKDKLLTTLNERQEATIGNMDDYQAKVINRSETNQKHNEEYLNSQVLKHTSEKEIIKRDYEQVLESANEQYKEVHATLASKEAQMLQDIAARKEEENAALNEYKQNAQQAITQLKTEASNKVDSLQSQNKVKIDELNQKFDIDTKAVKDELADQLDQHKDHLAVIEKSVNEESSQLEQETRKLTKVSEDKIKEDISIVDNKLKEDIQNIK